MSFPAPGVVAPLGAGAGDCPLTRATEYETIIEHEEVHMSNEVKSSTINIRLTATVTDIDGGEVDGWLDREYSSFQVLASKQEARVYQVTDIETIEDVEAAIENLIGAIDSFDGDTAYAADAEIGRVHGQVARYAAHIEYVDEYRRAVIFNSPADAVAAYLPSNYRVVGEVNGVTPEFRSGILIEGQDNAGWTLEDYVLPRLASGNYWGRALAPGELTNLLDAEKVTFTLSEQERAEATAPLFEVLADYTVETS